MASARVAVPPSCAWNPPRQLGDGGRLEEGAQRERGAEEIGDAGGHAHGEQRVPAELEEAVVDADVRALHACRLPAEKACRNV